MEEETVIVKLADLFKTRSASDWEGLLAHKGIGCVRADGLTPSLFWLEDEQAQSMNLTKNSTYPEWGDYKRHGPTALFSCGVSHLKGCPNRGTTFGRDSWRVGLREYPNRGIHKNRRNLERGELIIIRYAVSCDYYSVLN